MEDRKDVPLIIKLLVKLIVMTIVVGGTILIAALKLIAMILNDINKLIDAANNRINRRKKKVNSNRP